MKQHNSAVVKQEDAAKFEKWYFQQTVELEHTRKELEDTRKDVENERKELERERRQFEMERKLELDRMRQEQHMFDMKWKILEMELEKLAVEKQQVEKRKAFYRHVDDFEHEHKSAASNVVKGELFFMGVGNEHSLRKRYKDLIKIYHPDNLDGDTGTIQEINREYNVLKQKLDIS